MLRRPESWVFLILLGSFAFFWHSRDWNSASRLMLTYALVDRVTIRLDGLEDQTGDKAMFQGHYFTDKLPGFSFLAAGPYAVAKAVLRLPDHPLNRRGIAYWRADYWVTLGTSGVLSALTGALLTDMARDLGCGPRRRLLLGLAYGLATPAYAYATMSYGHQASAFALLASFGLLWRLDARSPALRMVLAGFLAAFAAVIELQVGPVSAILSLYLLAQVIGRRRRVSALGDFAVGALPPTLLLLGYNQLAFGSPWDMGYFHHATAIFAEVHNRGTRSGSSIPTGAAPASCSGEAIAACFIMRPIVALTPPGWVVLVARRSWGMAAVTSMVMGAVFLVNLSYPQWTGGWSTGPRLLVPLLPFALLPVAALLAVGGRKATWTVVVLMLAGGVLILLFQGVGVRLPQDIMNPLREAVWPLWRGDPVPPWATDGRFTRNLVEQCFPRTVTRIPERWRWIQFVPLVVVQALAIAAYCKMPEARSPEGQ